MIETFKVMKAKGEVDVFGYRLGAKDVFAHTSDCEKEGDTAPFAVTHLPTGLIVGYTAKKKVAAAFVSELEAMDVDWLSVTNDNVRSKMSLKQFEFMEEYCDRKPEKKIKEQSGLEWILSKKEWAGSKVEGPGIRTPGAKRGGGEFWPGTIPEGTPPDEVFFKLTHTSGATAFIFANAKFINGKQVRA